MVDLRYEIVDVNESNIDMYDLFCRKSKKNTDGYEKKVRWVKERFKEGLRLKLLLIDEGRGPTSRGFIEYIPGEYAWRGIDAEGYMVIHCIWVVGKHKKRGNGKRLLEECLNDAKKMHGVAVVTTEGNWLAGRKLFVNNGFERVDTAPPSFELYVKKFSDTASTPKFTAIPQERLDGYGPGITVLKSDQCPYLDDAVKILAEVASRVDLPFRIEQLQNCKEAQNGVYPYGTFCVLLDGKVLTYHYLLEKEIVRLLAEKGITVKEE